MADPYGNHNPVPQNPVRALCFPIVVTIVFLLGSVYIYKLNTDQVQYKIQLTKCEARKNELLKEVEFEREQRKKFCTTDVATQERFSSGSGSSSTELSENLWASFVNHEKNRAQEDARQNCEMVCNLKLDNRESTTKLDCHENVTRKEKEWDERCKSTVKNITLEKDIGCQTQIDIKAELAVLKKEKEVEKASRHVFDEMLKNKSDEMEARCTAAKAQIKMDKDMECQNVCQAQVSGAEVKVEYSTKEQCRFEIQAAVKDMTEQLQDTCRTQIDITNRQKDDQCKEFVKKNVVDAKLTAEADCRRTTEIALKNQNAKMSEACDKEVQQVQKITHSETARQCEAGCRANKDQRLKEQSCEVASFLRTIQDVENNVRFMENRHWSIDHDVIMQLERSGELLRTIIGVHDNQCKKGQ